MENPAFFGKKKEPAHSEKNPREQLRVISDLLSENLKFFCPVHRIKLYFQIINGGPYLNRWNGFLQKSRIYSF